jgi:hypothetical protein
MSQHAVTLSPMVARWLAYFRTQNPNLGKFKRILQWKMYILWQFGLYYGRVVCFVAIWDILRPFGIFYGYFGIYFSVLVCFTKISGNPAFTYVKW